jgi:hypothetical protein
MTQNEMNIGTDTSDRVKLALMNAGYSYEGITGATYAGKIKNGQEMHFISFEDEQDVGTLYVWFDDQGKLVADF